jgi:chromosomal replication initiation ATPase DnaA
MSEALALATALVSREPGAPRLLLLLGPPGVGKTHLLRSVVRQVGSRAFAVSIVQTDGSQLLQELLAALRRGDATSFQRRYAQAELLAVDDLHVLAGTPVTQKEVALLLKAAIDGGARVVCAAGCRPAEIPVLAAALGELPVARVVEMRRPGHADLRRILDEMGRTAGLRLTRQAVSSMARSCRGDVGRAIGELIRLEFQQSH